ncbi:hypothetical protein PMAYCL1PPCAC_04292, partial [Pristionchus mayeri]
PLSTALKCYLEKKGIPGEDDIALTEEQCIDADYCLTAEKNSKIVRICDEGHKCKKESCVKTSGEGSLCCCKGDLCNTGTYRNPDSRSSKDHLEPTVSDIFGLVGDAFATDPTLFCLMSAIATAASFAATVAYFTWNF